MHKKVISKQAFTLIELLVVVGIIAILTGVLAMAYGDVGRQQRDAERKTDLRALQSVLEEYKRREGVYPDPGCPMDGWFDAWSSESDCDNYIADVWPEYISELPTDPNLGDNLDSNTGFSYSTNSDRTVYKIMVRKTVEGETVTADHDLTSCPQIDGWCGSCDASSEIHQTSYGAWGGFANGDDPDQIKTNTEAIICNIQEFTW